MMSNQFGRYTVLQKVFSNSFGTAIYKAYDPIEKSNVCLKRQKTQDDGTIPCGVLREFDILTRVNHPNIIKPYQYLFSENNCWLVLPWIDKSLADFKKSWNQQKLLDVFQQVLQTLSFLHENEIYHCDIKPQNIMYVEEKNQIVLIDFGNSSTEGCKQSEHPTLNYTAPETLTKTCKDLEKVDVWSLGCVIVELLIGKRLFEEKSESSMLKAIRDFVKVDDDGSRKVASILRKATKDKQLVKVLTLMLSFDPNLRPSCQDVLEMMSMPSKTVISSIDYNTCDVKVSDKYLLQRVSYEKFFLDLCELIDRVHWMATAISLMNCYLSATREDTDMSFAVAAANLALKYHYNMFLTVTDLTDEFKDIQVSHKNVVIWEKRILQATGSRLEFSTNLKQVLLKIETQGRRQIREAIAKTVLTPLKE